MARSQWIVMWWAVFLAVVAATATGCGGPMSSKSAKFDEIVYPFYDAWRWKKLPSLAKRIDPETRQEFIEEYAQATSDVQFADYEVTEVEILDGGLTAQVSVTFLWYRLSDPTIVEAQLLETWEREKKGKPWYRTSQEVISGHMPGTI